MANPLRIISSVTGAVTVLTALFLGYGAYQTGEYSKLFIYFIILTAGVNLFFLGIHGRTALSPLGKKLICVGIGLLVIAVFMNYASVDSSQIKDDMANAMIDTIAEASARQVQEQLDSGEVSLPADKDIIRRSCSAQTEAADERSFSMQDLCEDIDKEENKDLSVEELMKKSLDRKTRELAEKQVREEIGENEGFSKMFESFDKGKRYVVILGIIGSIMFIAGCLFKYYGRDEKKNIKDVIYSISFSSTIACAINAAIFKIIEYIIKNFLMTGKVLENKFLQGILPAQTGANAELMQEVTKTMLMKIGEVMYSWLGVALSKAFMFSIILGIVFLTSTTIFFIIIKRSKTQEEKAKNKQR